MESYSAVLPLVVDDDFCDIDEPKDLKMAEYFLKRQDINKF